MIDSNKKSISSEILKETFGKGSSIYSTSVDRFRILWSKVENKEDIVQKYKSWEKSLEIVYGDIPEKELFFTHTYLAILVKLIMYFKLEGKDVVSKNELRKVVDGTYFYSYGILNFTENDFSTWVLHDDIVNESLDLVYQIAQKLSEYDFSKIDEDVFKDIYEELIARDERKKAGEYYTPEWLTQLILLEVLDLWSKEHKDPPKLLDPACGSGTFLCNAIRFLRERFPSMTLKDILNSVIGIDINPLACLMAKANYLIALGDLVKKGTNISIPIYWGDSLKSPPINEKVDIIVGNPPWIVMRNIKNKDYQDYLKKEVLKYGLLDSDDVHLFTQIEMASLFFNKCSDIYLKNKGIIGFVMPKSVIGGTIQHINFRRFRKPLLKLVRILDFENVYPLFNIPSCVLIAIKGEATKYPVVEIKYSGELPKRNAKWEEARNLLRVSRVMYIPPEFPRGRSYYFNKFKVGASIFPRTLYFIDIVSTNNNLFLVRTSDEIIKIVKQPWKVRLEEKVEPDFIYLTLLAWEIVPFGYVTLRPVLLPIKPVNNKYKLLDIQELQELGYEGIAKWFEKAQKIWEERRTAKSAKRFPRLIDRLNYNGLLTCQSPTKRYAVLYNATGTNVVSCVIDKKSLLDLGFPIKGFVADVKTWFYETDNEMEAYYLSAVLNSELLNKLIKPFQPRGLFGARAIHRRPLQFSIPKFNEENELHVKLAEISKACHMKVEMLLKGRLKRNGIRSRIRRELNNELKQIDYLVSKLLNIAEDNSKEVN